MFPIGRRFALSDRPGYGVCCDPAGVFVGAVPLLESCRNCGGFQKRRPRPLDEINRDLSRRYGVPVDFGAKMQGLVAIASALDRGDLLHAHIATLHLEIPDPPALAKGAQSATEIVALASELHASGMLKRDWDPSKHPRWPAGSPDSTGGRFAPGDASADTAPADESRRSRTAQLAPTIPIPFDMVGPRTIPLPPEFVPPLAIHPRRELENPYPDREGCDEEWAAAFRDCWELLRRKQLGKGDNRGSGKTFEKCVLGRVTERCGGNPTA